jgi:hypothetical protein
MRGSAKKKTVLFTDIPAIRFSELAISETHKDNEKTEIQAYRLK